MGKQTIFILSLFQHGYKARYSTLAHLLRGKRTTSILMYGFFYNILAYFSLFPNLTEKEVKQIIQHLLEAHLLIELSPGVVQISQKGRKSLERHPMIEHRGINSFHYGRVDEGFMELLMFATQVVSEYCHRNRQYQPIESNGYKQYLIRRWFQALPKDRQVLGQGLYREWQLLISSFPEAVRPFVVAALTGHGQIGLTVSQLADLRVVDPFEVGLVSKELCHVSIDQIIKAPNAFPYMNALYESIDKPRVNESALKSYQLFQKGYSLIEICHQRQLKESTVNDHLIEWAMMDETFDYNRVLADKDKELFLQLLRFKPNVRDWQYNDLGQGSHKISFLAFRCYQIQSIRGA